MLRTLVFLATLVLAGACAAPGVPTPAPTDKDASFASPRPTVEATSVPATFRPEEICAALELLPEVVELGQCTKAITVGLAANAEDLARELRAKYGDAIELSIGLFPYPPPDDPERACLSIRPISLDHSPLTAAVEVDPVIVAGTHYQGTVRLTNTGPVPFDLETSSSFSLLLFRPGESDPIGVSELGTFGTGYGTFLAPGEAIEFEAVGGTASCDLALGYVVPAGTYEVRALIDYDRYPDDPDDETVFFWSDPTAVEVVNG